MQVNESVRGAASGWLRAVVRQSGAEHGEGVDNANTEDAGELWKRVTALAQERAGGKLKLDIGAGSHPRGDDFVTVDLYVKTADIVATMWDIPLPDACVDEIWCSHAMEHVASSKVHSVFKEFWRLLKPGHRALILVPNFDYVARYWLTGPDRLWAEAMVYGHQALEGEFHKTAWSFGILEADLKVAGFDVDRIEVRFSHNQETLQAVVTKPILVD